MRRGFTLIELLVSLALLASLLAAVAGLLGLLDRRCRELYRELPLETWPDAVVEQLRWDLANSQSWELKPDALVLRGFTTFDAARQAAAMTRAETTYQIVSVDGGAWVVRRCTESFRLDNAPPQVDLVCAGVVRIELWNAGADEPVMNASGPIPEACELRLVRSGGQLPLIVRHAR